MQHLPCWVGAKLCPPPPCLHQHAAITPSVSQKGSQQHDDARARSDPSSSGDRARVLYLPVSAEEKESRDLCAPARVILGHLHIHAVVVWRVVSDDDRSAAMLLDDPRLGQEGAAAVDGGDRSEVTELHISMVTGHG